MNKEMKSHQELEQIILRLFDDAGLKGVKGVSIIRIEDPSVDFNWSVSGLSLGTEDFGAVSRFLHSRAVALLSSYSLV